MGSTRTSRSLPSETYKEPVIPTRRKLPKLMACITKQSLENMRNKALFSIDALDTKGIRRRKRPLWECLILELREAGFVESSNYLRDLLYDNTQLVEQDEIGIVVNLKNRNDYLEHISLKLQDGEREKDRGDTKKECIVFLKLGLEYAEKGKGILWLAEKFFLVAIAIASRYMLDGGRLKGVCKYFYAKFLLDKFPGADTEEPFLILTEVRDVSIGKDWPLLEPTKEDPHPKELLYNAVARQLHRVLLHRSRLIRRCDAAKAERLARLAERRGMDANDPPLVAEAIIEVGICQLAMDNLNNAKMTFLRAFKLNEEIEHIPGLCATRMHLASVLQRLGDHEQAAQLLTEMGALAMEYGLRRELGLALHLLGELHLRRERPELGTQHLAEAFSCFMGSVFMEESKPLFNIESGVEVSDAEVKPNLSSLGTIYRPTKHEIYTEEAERSRFMTAISAGQEVMASYFRLLHAARTCTVATVQCIEWKLAQIGWWVKRPHHAFVPCPCSVHNRTPLDVLWAQISAINAGQDISVTEMPSKSVIKIAGERMNQSITDMKQLHSESRLYTAEREPGKRAVTMEGDKVDPGTKESENKETEKKDTEKKDSEEKDTKETGKKESEKNETEKK
ncbi:hypothetical protein NE865_06632 [Phthorimaea operculella]|nr:hypothetical protein NE865_06632 [Phthorimaea operculella]